MATLEDVKNCPKCGSAGKQARKDPRPGGKTVYTFQCVNSRCRWFETGWAIQVNADGSVPEPEEHTDRNKMFPKMTDSQKTMAQRQIDEAAGA